MTVKKLQLDPFLDIRVSLDQGLDSLWKDFPNLYNALTRADSGEAMRARVFTYIEGLSAELYLRPKLRHPLEQSNARQCLRVLRNIFAAIHEEMAGFSALDLLARLARNDQSAKKEASVGFVLEIYHLLQGACCESGIYELAPHSYAERLEGREAALARSEALDDISAKSAEMLARYTSGLDKNVQAEREENRRRIMSVMGCGQADWNNWKWQVAHVIRDAGTLARLIEISPDKRRAVEEATANSIPFGIAPHYLSLMDRRPDGRDEALRAQVIPDLEYVRQTLEFRKKRPQELDFMRERDTSPIDLVTRRYPMIAILKPFNTCPQICVYCQRNWEICEAMSPDAMAPAPQLEQAIQWIGNTETLSEILITGGDPAILSERILYELLEKLASFEHLRRIRIGTRTPVTVPQRIDERFTDMLAKYHVPGRREICVVTHFEHLYELCPEAVQAVQRLRKRGIPVKNQMVFTFFNSRRFEAVATRAALRLVGVEPYYTFNTKGKDETRRYRAPIARLLQEFREEGRLMPGLERTDSYVFNIPGMGKNYLRSWQNHEVISIRPDGGRTYLFMPWEKGAQLADVYVYDDVPILEYMRRLKDTGEDLTEYRTIWYYF